MSFIGADFSIQRDGVSRSNSGLSPREIADALRQFGCEVELLRDHLPIRAPDADVIANAQERGSILVFLNRDFADIVAYRPEAYGGIVAIQLHDHPETIPTLVAG